MHRLVDRARWAVASGVVLAALATVTPAWAQGRGVETWVDPDRTAPSGMHYDTFASEHAGSAVSYLVYLPPSYDSAADRRYPVIYWLHGLGGRQTSGARLAARLDRGIRARAVPETIVVSVNGLRASMYSDSKDGRWPVEQVIVQDLVTHVDGAYRTIARREGRAIAGMSMGGYGALRLGFKYPELFGAISSFAAALHTEDTLAGQRAAIFEAVYGGDAAYARRATPWTLTEQGAERVKARTVIRQIIGTADGLFAWNEQYHELLDRLGVAHDYVVVPDVAHNYAALDDAVGDGTLAFYRRAFDAAVAAAKDKDKE